MSVELRRISSNSRDGEDLDNGITGDQNSRKPLMGSANESEDEDDPLSRHVHFNERISMQSEVTRFSNLDDSDEHSLFTFDPRSGSGFQNPRYVWIRNALINGIFVVLWYGFSVTLSVYNKWMFSEDHLNFNFPIMTTAGHQVVQTVLASVLLSINRFVAIPLIPHRSYKQEEDQRQLAQQPLTSKITSYFKHIVPCAAAGAGDIGFGNASYRLVTLSFYTMVKSSSLGFVLMFGILFALERATWQIFSIVSVMTVGVIMMAAGEAHFQLVGFLLVLTAAMCSGIRWSLTQILLRRSSGEAVWATKNDPIRTILYLNPATAVLLFVMGIFVEGLRNISEASLWHEKGVIVGLLLLIIPGLLAFCMTVAEFILLQRTSVLTLSIVGIAKEIVTIITATIFFGDKLTVVNGIGLMVTIGSILAYNSYRYMEFVRGESDQ
jgi:solute carrier family 35, member C2